MTTLNCPNCGGTHYGSVKCPFIKEPCVVCGAPTVQACSDCAISSGGRSSAHVCDKPECMREHGKMHPSIVLPTSAQEMIEFIRRPETTILDLVRWIVERGFDVTISLPEARDPSKPGSFYVNDELAMTHDEWAAKPVPPTPPDGAHE